MAKQIRVISDEDWEVLKRLVASNQNLLQNAPTRPSATSQYLDGDDSMSPEVYIALPPAGGIPALGRTSSTGTGSGTSTNPQEWDTPGQATCGIYQIILDSNQVPNLIKITGPDKVVYNLSPSALSQDWITIHRDKFGKWIPVSSTLSASVNINRGKLLTTLSSGSRVAPVSAVVEVWQFDGTEWLETNPIQQLTVYDDGMVGSANAPLGVGTWIQMVKIGSYWFYDGHNCDPSTGTAS